jgi:predicted 3-demethylubiquinone-9 3-methyltransferase (glyoxalase superfamily)
MLTRFELDGVSFAALNGGPHFKLSEAVSLVALCDTQGEIDRLWSALTADGGAESQCGWLKDRFGLSWQILPSMLEEIMGASAAEGSKRAFQSLMGMRKINIVTLQQAANG